MGEQALDLRSGLAVLRRQRQLIGGVALLGAVLGGLVPVTHPPTYSSTTEVLLPATRTGSTDDTTSASATQIRVAMSETVLGPAGRAAAPSLSWEQLSHRVKVSAPSEQTLAFTVSAPTASAAQGLARAIATSELDYIARASADDTDNRVLSLLDRISQNIQILQHDVAVAPSHGTPQMGVLSSELASLSGQLQSLTAGAQPVDGVATVIQPASTATRPTTVRAYGFPIVTGLLAGFVLAAATALLFARRDRRLRSRDRLAAAVGRPVVASFAGRGARSPGGWHQLLSHYEPAPVDAWALRQLLREVPVQPDGRRQLTFLSPEGDGRGVAAGALFAAHAAGIGIATELVVGDISGNWALASVLRHADGRELHPLLRVSRDRPTADASLTVVVTATTQRTADLEGPAVVAVTSGTATVDKLARTAVIGEDAGVSIIGVVVVDPDSDDRTSGRLFGRGGDATQSVDVPTRMPGLSSTGTEEELAR